LDRAPNITCIDLHNNKLNLLPDEVTDLRKLKTLKVSNNDLSDLNPRLALLTSLVRINIEGNPLKCIKTTLRGAGAEPLKEFLKLRLTENEIAKDEIN
jgi:Leucine-rich repeat (LRR) protein